MTQLEKALNKLPITKPLRKELYRGIISNNLTKVTWKELKDLRDNSQLVPGCWYRMTDYECIVAPSNEYKSAGHQFDLLILATDVNKLSEDCKACRHEGDTYFPEDTNFEAWEVKYCIDNDANKYDWVNDTNIHPIYIQADLELIIPGLINYSDSAIVPLTTDSSTEIPDYPYQIDRSVSGIKGSIFLNGLEGNVLGYIKVPQEIMPEGYPNILGPIPVNNVSKIDNDKNSKGIIYNLKDDRNNTCGYDFKNILFKRYEITSNLLKESQMSNLLNYISKDPTITIDFDTIMTNKQGFLGLFTTAQTGFDINTEDYKYFYTFCLYDDINDKVIDTTVFPTLIPSDVTGVTPYSQDNIIYSGSWHFGSKNLPDNVFVSVLSKPLFDDMPGAPFVGNILKDNCYQNTIHAARYLTMGENGSNNVIGSAVRTSIENNFHDNKIGVITTSIIGNEFGDNIMLRIRHSYFGNYCWCNMILVQDSFCNNFDQGFCQNLIACRVIYDCNFEPSINTNIFKTTNGYTGDMLAVTVKPDVFCVYVENMNRCTIESNVYGSSKTEDGVTIETKVKIIGKATSGKVIAKNSQGKLVAYNPADLASESAIIQ